MSLRTLIISSAETDMPEFAADIGRYLDFMGEHYDVCQYSGIPDRSPYKRIFISASPRGDDIVNGHQIYYDWVEDTKIPVFGICAGHHIIGVRFGAGLIEDKQSEGGICYVDVVKPSPLFDGYDNRFSVFQNHNDSIELPEDFELLGRSDRCPVQVMSHKSSPILTVQFHSERWNPQMIGNFMKADL